jgi:hypothetical protein
VSLLRSLAATLPSLAALAILATSVACVIETEPGPRKTLLRDAVRRQAVPSASTSASVATIPQPPPVPEAFRTCDIDADCVAVLPNGCCQDGRNVALNRGLVDAYRSAFVCPLASPVCPMHLVLDDRVAACDAPAHLCKLVEPPAPPPSP